MAAAAASQSADPNEVANGCASEFEVAQRTDMESFRAFDAETWRAGHHPDAITVFSSGEVCQGIDAIMAATQNHFANKNGVWKWVELHRVVDGCKSAFILYETTYEVPSTGLRLHALTGVTYTYDGSRWLAIADQGTPLR